MAGVSDLLTGAMKSLGDGLHEKISKVSAIFHAMTKTSAVVR